MREESCKKGNIDKRRCQICHDFDFMLYDYVHEMYMFTDTHLTVCSGSIMKKINNLMQCVLHKKKISKKNDSLFWREMSVHRTAKYTFYAD